MNNTLKQVIKLLQTLVTPEEVIVTKRFQSSVEGGCCLTFRINKTSQRISVVAAPGDTLLKFSGRKVSTFAGFANCFSQAVAEANKRD